MASERVVRREVTQETVQPTETVVEETVTETTQTVQPVVPVVPAQPANANVNVNANPDPAAGGQVNIQTPDGTQVNINQ